MRRAKFLSLLLGFLLIAPIIVGQNPQKNTVRQSDESRDLQTFTGIETSGGIDVYIIQGEPQKVFVISDKDIAERIITEVVDNTLNIYHEHWTFKMRKVKVLVTMKDIKNLKCSGGSDIFSKKQLVVGNIALEAGGGSDIDLDLKAIEIDGEAAGGSDIRLKGAAGYLKLNASGGSDCKAYDLTVAKANVSASGGSDIYVKVDEELKASASGGSDIRYKGSAKITNIDSSGGSDILRE